MSSPAALSKEFQFPQGIDGSVKGIVAGSLAPLLATNAPFPAGPLTLGSAQINIEPGKRLAFASGTATIGFGASLNAGLFDDAPSAVSALDLDLPKGLAFGIAPQAGTRYLLLEAGWNASGSFSGSHPIGAIGTLTFGVSGKASQRFSVLHRIASNAPSRSAMAETVAAWRLPRSIDDINDLSPGTWIVAEADGSIAARIGAKLGWNFSFMREVQLLNLTQKLGARLDAAVTATLGFTMSGSYIIVVGRESAGQTLNLKLFRESSKGLSFGLNVDLGATGQVPLPPKSDNFLQAVFGVHGTQVLRDLKALEDWAGSDESLGQTLARLSLKEGKELLQSTTGLDPETEFNKAKQLVSGVVAKWNNLPQTLSGELWAILRGMDDTKDFESFLRALADPAKTAALISSTLGKTSFASTTEGRFLLAIAGKNLPKLLTNANPVQKIAQQVLDALDGGIIKRLQSFIGTKLDLDQVLKVATQADFNQISNWLTNRLSDFLDEKLTFVNVDKVKTTIKAIQSKREEIFQMARKALNSRYSLTAALAIQSSSSSSALLDVDFDFTVTEARQLFKDVMRESALDRLFTDAVAGVTLHSAVLTHQIDRSQSIELNVGGLNFATLSSTTSQAKVTAEEAGGRVLLYQTDANNTVTVRNRYKSELSFLANAEVRDGALQLPDDTSELGYRNLRIVPGADQAELQRTLAPFLHAYFGATQTLPSLPGGDALVSAQVFTPSTVVNGWLRPMDVNRRKAASMEISRTIQRTLRRFIPWIYFQDRKKLGVGADCAALMVWSVMPVSTSIGPNGELNTDKKVFWDFENASLRRAMTNQPQAVRTAIEEAGIDVRVDTFIQTAQSQAGDVLVKSLLFVEAQVIDGAVKSLNAVQDALDEVAKRPTVAVEKFAEFGAEIVETFNKDLNSVYRGDALKPLGSAVFAEVCGALDRSAVAAQAATVSVTVLRPGSAFVSASFLDGEVPEAADMAASQTLVSAPSTRTAVAAPGGLGG